MKGEKNRTSILRNEMKALYKAICREATERQTSESTVHPTLTIDEINTKCGVLLEHLPSGVLVCDEDGTILFANRMICDDTRYALDELLQMNVADLDVGHDDGEDDDDLWRTNTRDLTDQSVRLESTYRRRDRSTYPVEVHMSAIALEDRPVVLAVTRDISERKQAVAALQEREAQLSAAVKISQLGYWEFDVSKRRFTFNDQFYDLFRTRAEDVGGYELSPERYMELFVHPDDTDVVTDRMRQAAQSEEGGLIPPTEHRILYADGEIGYMSVRCFVVKDEQGQTIRTYGANQDITEQKRAEQERLLIEEQLRRSQKLETIGTLAGGIAHDFNNILTPIVGYAEMALSELPKDNSLFQDFEEIFFAAKRARDLISQILTFSRELEQERQALSLHVIIAEAFRLLRPSIPATIEIKKEIDSSCGKVLADPAQMHQVLVNLCTNGFQAMEQRGEGRGSLAIELKQVSINAAAAKGHAELSEGEYVRLSVSDTGVGMDEATMDRIFEPFFTTKPVDKGTGMGLCVVHGIVKAHSGTIVVNSTPGTGSVFHVYLPLLKDKALAGQSKPPRIKRGDESILIVDDEASVSKVLARMMKRLGYHVTSTTSGKGALDLLAKGDGQFDLVITDLSMPTMSGTDLARAMRIIGVSVPVILMTGYGIEVSPERQKECGIVTVLAKPVELHDLAAKIREVLDETKKVD